MTSFMLLIGAMLMMTQMGKTEAEAQAWLKDFVLDHYLPVWRKIVDK